MKAEPKNLSAIFSSTTSYKIPVYQRPYAWDISGWSSIIDDFVKLHEETRPKVCPDEPEGFKVGRSAPQVRHFVGAIVIYKYSDSDDHFHIVDGQQRLTTMLLMIAGLLDALKTIKSDGSLKDNDDHNLAHDLENRLFKSLEGMLVIKEGAREADASSADSHTLVLLSRDEAIYNKIIELAISRNIKDEKYDTGKDKKIGSHRDKAITGGTREATLIDNCFRYFSEYFYGYVKNGISVAPSNIKFQKMFFESIVRTIEKSFEFAVIKVEQHEKPQEIFESLNARSKPLGAFDLIKNFVLMEISTLPGVSEKDKDKLIGTEYKNKWESFELNEFWSMDQSTNQDSRGNNLVDNKTVFLNYWLDANNHKINAVDDNSILPSKAIGSFGQHESITAMADKNSDVRFNSKDAIFWEYRSYLNSKKVAAEIAKASQVAEGKTETSSYITVFSKQLSRDAKFYYQAIKAIENGLVYSESYDEDEYDVLNDINKTFNVNILLDFIARVIQGYSYRAMWKLVFWIIKERPENSKISRTEFEGYLKTLDIWASRRYVFSKKYPIQDLNVGTNYIVNHMIQRETACNNFAKNSSKDQILAIQPNKVLIAMLLQKTHEGKKYLKIPDDHELISELPLYAVPPGILVKIKYIFTALENAERGFVDFGTRSSLREDIRERIDPNEFNLTTLLPSDRIKKQWRDDLRNAPSLCAGENLSEEEIVEKIKEREKYQKSIGNLTLIHNDNGEKATLPKHKNWSERKEYLSEEANDEKFKVELNSELTNKSEWGVTEIRNNTHRISEKMITLWPYPNINIQ